MKLPLMFVVFVFLACSVNIGIAQRGPATDERANSEIQDLITFLSVKANFSEKPSAVADAIVRLGNLRAVEAIPLLIEHIDLYDERDDIPSAMLSILTGRVAAKALVRIGKPSVQPVLESSKKEDNDGRLRCMAAVLVEIEGRKNAAQLVESAIAEAKDKHVTARLHKLMSLVPRSR